MKVKACPYCETIITQKESDKIPETCPDCGKQLNSKEMLILDSKETSDYVSKSNKISSIFRVLGYIIMFLAVILGLISIFTSGYYFGLLFFISGASSGLFMLGFSEIISLLHQINLKMK